MTEFELDDFAEDIEYAERSIGINTEATKEPNGDENGPGQQASGIEAINQEKQHNQKLGLFSGISNDDYHRGPGVSSTQLKHELACSKLYRAYETGEIVFEPTKQMRLGSAVHVLSLEPFDFDQQVGLLPKKAQGNAKYAKENKKEFMLEHHGKIIIHEQEMDTVRRMRDALFKHPEAGELLTDPSREVEMSGYYLDKDEETNIGTHMLLKYRPDIRFDWCIGDIKSTVDASEEAFSRTVGNFGYDVSASHYLAGDKAAMGTNHNNFVFLCVESAPPYLVAVYYLDEVGLRVGEWRRRKALYSIKQCRLKQHWPGYNKDKVKSISVSNHLIYQIGLDQ